MKKTLMAIVVSSLLAITVHAQALTITPATTPQWSGDQTSQAEINTAIAGLLNGAVELYKMNVGGPEEGSLAGSYDTTFADTPTDPSGATITYMGGDIVDGLYKYLLVKDGNQSPAWYLFDISGWNGMETIDLSGFWPRQGAISHVTLYGTSNSVPEPGTILLLGAGLIGVGIFGRKRIKG